MSVRGVSSQGNSIESMSTKEICILVATDDFTWHNIVTRMLQICTYQVLDTGKADDVLTAIWERKEHVSVVFTNVHRLSSIGFDILQNIKSRLNLQTIVMSPDDENVAISEKGSIFVAYLVKFLNVNDIKNLWQSSLEIEKLENLKENHGGKQKASGTTECNTRTSPIDEVTRLRCKRGREESFEEDEEPTDGRDDGPAEKKQRMKETSIDEVTRVHCKRGREESSDESEESEDGRKYGRAEKKTRMVWTGEMHQKFLEAIEILGHEKAFPKKIVEVMEVPGLTRENVASHLQKYRMCIKRAQESDPNPLHGMNRRTAVQNQCLSSGVPPLLSNFSYGNSYLRRNVHGAYVQPPFRRTLPNVLYPSAAMFPKSSQMDVRNPQWINENGHMNNQYGYAPNVLLKSNFRVYNDPKKNVLMNIGGRSSLDAKRPSKSDHCTSFLGFRLTGDGKSVEAGGKCIATSIKPTGSETLPEPHANGNTSQLASTLNESQTSLLSVEDYDYAEENLIQPPSLSENCILGQEPLSEQSSLLENELINLYSPNPPENEYSNRHCSSPLDSTPQQQSFFPFYQTFCGVSPAKSSMPDDTSSQQQVFMPPCQASGDMLAAQCSMPLDPILQHSSGDTLAAQCSMPMEPIPHQSSGDMLAAQCSMPTDPILQLLHSPPLYEIFGNEISAQCSMPVDPILQKLPSLSPYEVLGNDISAQCSMPMDPILQQLRSPPLYEVFGNEISAECSMPMDPILQQLPSPPLYEVLGNEISAQSPTVSNNFTRQHQYSVPPVPTSANVGTFQYIATKTTHDSPLPSIPSTLDELEGILSDIGDDFWNNDIDDITSAITIYS